MTSSRLDITLLRERSSGTFAKVYLAEASGMGGISRLVAVKILREKWAQADEFVARTKDEARMLAQLRHPSIVRVEDLVELNGQLAIIMEFVDGVDLQQLCDTLAKRGQKLPPRVAYSVIYRAAAALDVAWRKAPYGRSEPIRVVHRDVKPSNMMLTAQGELKVLDFGTARGSFEERAAHTTMFRFGSLKYMSPERRAGDRGDHPSDVYSLGLMLLEFLRGEWAQLLPEPPDHAWAVEELVKGIRDTGMPAQDWDDAARRVLLQMLADEPSHRPTAEQAIKLMQAFADQASGPSLEAFCYDVVEDLVREVYPDKGGALSGAQLTIDQPVARPPRPDAAVQSFGGGAPAAEPHAAEPHAATPAAQRGAQSFGDVAAPALGSGERQAPVAEPGGVNAPTWQRGQPLAPLAHDAAPPAAPRESRDNTLIIVAAAALAFVLFLGVALAGAAWFFLGGDDADPVVEIPPPEVEVDPTPKVDEAVPVEITLEGGAVQWVRLLDRAGETVIRGSADGLSGEAEIGDYSVAVKQVGRQPVGADVTLPRTGLRMRCTPEKKGSVTCEVEGLGPLTLE